MDSFRILIKENLSCLQSRSRLTAILRDMYPTEKLLVNIAITAYDAGIPARLFNMVELDTVQMASLVRILTDQYGLQEKYAVKAILMWASVADVKESFQGNYNGSTKVNKERIIHDSEAYSDTVYRGTSNDYVVKSLNDGTLEIQKYRGFDEDTLVVPNYIDGKRVTGIGKNAFENCKQLKSIRVSEGITYIGNAAFKNCERLEQVDLPSSLEKLGYTPEKEGFTGFDGAGSFEDIFASFTGTGGRNLRTSEGVFSGCPIQEIELPNRLNYIGDQCFFGCNKLERVDLPNRVQVIPERCFAYCDALREVKMPDQLKTIERAAFFGCRTLQSVNFPNSLTKIGYEAFSNCSSLTRVRMNEGVLGIGDFAFAYCDALEKIVIPRSTRSIGNQAFASKRGLFVTLYCYPGSYGVEYARNNGHPMKNATSYV